MQILDSFSRNLPTHTAGTLFKLRDLIFKIAEKHPEIGPIEESLKWGQPSYAPQKKCTGTPIRLGTIKDAPHKLGLFVHCQTDIIENFRLKHNTLFEWDKTRALIIDSTKPIPFAALETFILMALTYHIKKK